MAAEHCERFHIPRLTSRYANHDVERWERLMDSEDSGLRVMREIVEHEDDADGQRTYIVRWEDTDDVRSRGRLTINDFGDNQDLVRQYEGAIKLSRPDESRLDRLEPRKDVLSRMEMRLREKHRRKEQRTLNNAPFGHGNDGARAALADDRAEGDQDEGTGQVTRYEDALEPAAHTHLEDYEDLAPESVASEGGEGANVDSPRTSPPATGPEQPIAQKKARRRRRSPLDETVPGALGKPFASVDGKREHKQKKHHDE